jgi:hypothetical protein
MKVGVLHHVEDMSSSRDKPRHLRLLNAGVFNCSRVFVVLWPKCDVTAYSLVCAYL